MNTYIVTNISENLDYFDETRNTLKFAENAQHVIILFRYKHELNKILLKHKTKKQLKDYKMKLFI